MPHKGFRLGQLLELRTREEEQKQLELAALVGAERALREELQRLAARIEEHLDSMSARSLEADIDAAQREASTLYLEQLRARFEEQQRLIEDYALRVTACREELTMALRQRQVLEKLRDRQQAVALREADQREAKAVDDMSAVRYSLARAAKGRQP